MLVHNFRYGRRTGMTTLAAGSERHLFGRLINY